MQTSATLLYILRAHSEEVGRLQFSPDGKTLISTDDNVIVLWDLGTGALRSKIEDQDDMYFDLAFSGDSRRLVTTSCDGYARISSTETGELEQTISVEDERMLAVAFSPDGELLATGSEIARLWDVDTGTLREELLCPGDRSLSLEAVWQRNEYPAEITQLLFSPGGKTLVSVCDGTVRLWDTQTWKLSREIQGQAPRFSPDGQFLAMEVTDSTAIEVYDTTTWQLPSSIENRGQAISSPTFSPDGKVIATHSGRCITLWDVQSGVALRSFENHGSKISTLAFSPDGKALVSGSRNCGVRVWNVRTGECELVLEHDDGARNPRDGWVRHGPNALEVLFNSGGGRVAIAFPDGSLRVWDLRWEVKVTEV